MRFSDRPHVGVCSGSGGTQAIGRRRGTQRHLSDVRRAGTLHFARFIDPDASECGDAQYCTSYVRNLKQQIRRLMSGAHRPFPAVRYIL